MDGASALVGRSVLGHRVRHLHRHSSEGIGTSLEVVVADTHEKRQPIDRETAKWVALIVAGLILIFLGVVYR